MQIQNDEIFHHVYNRGAHKANIFLDNLDYIRMIKLLYIANNDEPFILSRLPENVFAIDRKKVLVDIVAYCLMPNHIHIALKKRTPGKSPPRDNMTIFIHKLMTGYSSYFNIKYSHSGTIWQGAYKEKPVYDETYIQTLINYIHLNPCDLIDPLKNTLEARVDFAINYEYSSLKDFNGVIRPQSAILNDVEVRPMQSVEVRPLQTPAVS